MHRRPQACYYCPDSIDRPGHIRATAPAQLRPHAGPPGAEPGGRSYGAPFDHTTEQGWHQAPGGWWVWFPDGFLPSDALRIGAISGFICGPWLCPQIINADGTVAVTQRLEVVDGEPVMRPLPHLARLVDDCRQLLTCDDEVRALADTDPKRWLRLVELNYHLTTTELAGLGWATTDLGEAMLKGACGIDPNVSPEALRSTLANLESSPAQEA